MAEGSKTLEESSTKKKSAHCANIYTSHGLGKEHAQMCSFHILLCEQRSKADLQKYLL